ncbi:Cys-tRNA(Pro) deacylase [Nitrincola alkalilacustris]|uniref:Cys-tRNA(Pro) deacylase n=1 Tax=Nitrincola alkalilacustris TaxID=1571224 RepID=UPI00124F7444|nr:Cys-tRNA(Pro) deacylase [Nitrincola alkalilacustris]
MTPAITALKGSSIQHRVHEYIHDPAAESWGVEAAEKLGVRQEQVFKTLVVETESHKLLVAIIPVNHKLNMKHLAKAAGCKRTVMAPPATVERSSGYVLGGVSPLGQKKKLNTYLDASALQFDTIYVSAGRRGLEIELSPQDLMRLTQAVIAPLQAE